MIHTYVIVSIAVLLSVMILVIIGQKMKVAYPIFLVIAGLLISLVPGMPHIEIEPDLVFLIFLPPILFEAAWFTSWQDFHKWRKQIFSMAFGLVFLTSIVVAYLSSSIIPGLTVAMGFLLGGVNSPPDAVAATSVLKHMKIPKKITTILEGESLINDASSLIVFKFALAAVISGQFIFGEAVKDFFSMAIGGIAVGIGAGFVFGALLKIIPSNSNIDTIITLIVPYVMYIGAEHFHFSGVLAVVAGGLVMSYNSHCYLSHTSRIQSGNVWSVLIFLMNTLIFILIGLELPVVVAGMENYTISEGIFYSIVIGGAIIITRIIYSYAIMYFPRLCSKELRMKMPKPDWREPFVISFAAMRGVVSLAAALSIPAFLPNGEAFPHRNIILFVTFVIILITLVGQGLLLAPILKLLKMEDAGSELPEEKQEVILMRKLKETALRKINEDFSGQVETNNLVRHQKYKLENEMMLMADKAQCMASAVDFAKAVNENKDVLRQVIQAQRNELHHLKKEKIFDDHVLRAIEMQLDFDEAKITGFSHD
ncbi:MULTISPECIES: Na+/H+ antiporter [Chryseobacterium]|uniref:Na+/H+ antiporter n=1 Tax=Chryseobacterium camelliae TaxID=1265445 RepID=A0ABU0THS1_9FLAO|nr:MULTISPECIES: Na+/H+ antiporter [Chryseobacterium]MDT3409540.1 Na+/H+ antiporter [Pseudacidovorax intermedius]MDQ1096597.1 Na+/H+ antiporter [Chryseobacterium camelliae]MDQ1100538.1 Na+/H+ antiporter [Chryseobacterium sp. SORGH_AS_1048]MDR6087879.1 Na+/H+ antiporter [Chryseobacterium sp. SORGH_AS_0909]MDR6132254.1 Na+/H+ antiporter [Chryseobacterium sp. SORGH_AS_1175]